MSQWVYTVTIAADGYTGKPMQGTGTTVLQAFHRAAADLHGRGLVNISAWDDRKALESVRALESKLAASRAPGRASQGTVPFEGFEIELERW